MEAHVVAWYRPYRNLESHHPLPLHPGLNNEPHSTFDSSTHTIPVRRPEVRRAPLAIAPQQLVPGMQLLWRDIVAACQRIVCDLTSDYDFAHVPRDLGNTQLRVDYSNEPGYWDEVAAAAVLDKKKRKRSLADAGHSNNRWLEEEFRVDAQADSWIGVSYRLPGTVEFTIYPGGTCPDLSTETPPGEVFDGYQ
ncbi:hypothetical protein F5B22DRAFT_650901 [Xylaria bambusicola]|uniref:uncharacterized protein n=1 Tax=Xylaria bambusicola TaxID=326684 RepID=UPI00200725D2|nr:uncharacterized protein F5B22DRAFT_650901 [Xylaria bambusicola]KAI0506341.1 hypothetical protein F5B22DRAFT_650901 [Xylaria bambusicola]